MAGWSWTPSAGRRRWGSAARGWPTRWPFSCAAPPPAHRAPAGPRPLPADLSPELRGRLRQDNGQRRFVLYEDGASGTIVLTQPDIRQVQLAKAAIRIGVEVLLEETNLRPEDIEGVFVGGAFGSSVRAESLLALGVLPEALRGRIHSVGNVAGMGAKLALIFPERFAEARRLGRRLRHVQLGGRPDFQARFARHLRFPDS